MLIEIPKEKLLENLIRQLNSFFFVTEVERELLYNLHNLVLTRTEYCFSHNKNKYYKKNDRVYFSPYHSSQYAIYLYYFSNTIFKNGSKLLADKLFYLNKIMKFLRSLSRS